MKTKWENVSFEAEDDLPLAAHSKKRPYKVCQVIITSNASTANIRIPNLFFLFFFV